MTVKNFMSIHKKLGNYKLIAGLGKTGISCVRYYRQLDCPVVVTDSRESPPGLKELQDQWPEVPVHIGGLDEKLLSGADELILSPGISLNEPFVLEATRKSVPVIGDIEVFCRIANSPIIAITGSNAKSTVSTLVAKMIDGDDKRVLLGGNIGVPAMDLLLEEEPDFYVLELSSFQLETVSSLKAAVACVLNISLDHMDRYANESDYIFAKQVIYENAEVSVINKDDLLARPSSLPQSEKYYYFTHQQPGVKEFGLIEEDGSSYLAFENRKLMATSDLKIKGSHNADNALAALAIGYAIGLDLTSMIGTLKSFSGLPYRCEWLGEVDGVVWINDSKGTNVGATEAAIKGFSENKDKNIILILGGESKSADFHPLVEPVKKYVREIILFGQDARIISNALGNAAKKHVCKSLQEVVILASKLSSAGDTVLFSPACASFDMFDDFEDRGKQFANLFKKLIGRT